MTNRVVITGMGAVTPLGIGVPNFWRALVQGVSGVDRLTRIDTTEIDCKIGAEVKDFDPLAFMDRKDARRMDRFTQFFLASAKEASADARLDLAKEDRERVGVTVGSGIGGMETLDEQFRVLLDKGPGRVSPFFIPMMIANMGAAQVAMQLGVKGLNYTVVTACASANDAVGLALRAIRSGEADVMIAGGAEAAFVPVALAGFASMKALSTRNDEPQRASRPFDAERDGFVMGEGAGALILESLEHARAREALILAEVAGYGATSDAYHLTAPAPEGEGGARAMRLALADARMRPEEIDYINAHGTSTPPGDRFETMAIKKVFGEHAYKVLVSSTKSMTGHLLGASGAIELIACVKAIQEGIVPPTINHDHPDPDCDLDYVPNRARRAPVRAALTNSFGFGGQNSTLIVRHLAG